MGDSETALANDHNRWRNMGFWDGNGKGLLVDESQDILCVGLRQVGVNRVVRNGWQGEETDGNAGMVIKSIR